MNYVYACAIIALLLSATVAATAAQDLVTAGEFVKIYDPSVGEKQPWYINDHCFARGANGMWHLFGITHAEPADPIDEDNFAHAIAMSLNRKPWDKKRFALTADPSVGETHLWAPCVVSHKGVHYMFYCAGGEDNTKYKINLATSTDLWAWKRHPKNPMVVDGWDARDPFVLKNGDKWVMYYTATSDPGGGNHIVAYRTSSDLVTWGERHTAFTEPGEGKGTYGGPCESPFVVKRGEYFYLFVGPRGGYRGTDVFRSKDPCRWDLKDQAGHIDAHAAEVIHDTDDKWYVSHCGWGQGGVFLAPLYWHDGVQGP